MSFIVFGSVAYFVSKKFLSPDLDLYISVNKYHFQKPIGPEPRIYFCFDLFKNQIRLNKNCDLNKVEPNHCGIQNEGPKGWDSLFLKSDPKLLADKTKTMLLSHKCKTVVLDFEGISNNVDFNRYWKWKTIYTQSLKKYFPVSLAAYPKTERTSLNPAAYFHDYSKICNLYDEIWLMTYDYHIPPYTPPGDIAPLNWVKQVVNYALIHCDQKQIRIGLATYGYDWDTGKTVLETQSFKKKSINIHVETAEKRKEKILYFHKKNGIHKFFIWAEGMFTLSH